MNKKRELTNGIKSFLYEEDGIGTVEMILILVDNYIPLTIYL